MLIVEASIFDMNGAAAGAFSGFITYQGRRPNCGEKLAPTLPLSMNRA